MLDQFCRAYIRHVIYIAAQYLQTRAEVGYVVIDMDVEHSELALAMLAEVPGTLRSRVLF